MYSHLKCCLCIDYRDNIDHHRARCLVIVAGTQGIEGTGDDVTFGQEVAVGNQCVGDGRTGIGGVSNLGIRTQGLWVKIED